LLAGRNDLPHRSLLLRPLADVSSPSK